MHTAQSRGVRNLLEPLGALEARAALQGHGIVVACKLLKGNDIVELHKEEKPFLSSFPQ